MNKLGRVGGNLYYLGAAADWAVKLVPELRKC
jgi:hypothetical protein